MWTSDEHVKTNDKQDPKKNDDSVVQQEPVYCVQDEKSATGYEDKGSQCDSSEIEDNSVQDYLIPCVKNEQLDPNSEDEISNSLSPLSLLHNMFVKVAHIQYEMKQRPLRIKKIEQQLERTMNLINVMNDKCYYIFGNEVCKDF